MKSNGEGTIYTEIRNGKNYYRAQVVVGDSRKSFSGYDKKDVLKRMQECQYKANAGLISSSDKITLAEWFFIYLFDFRINDLKPSTFERYECIYRLYIKDTKLGNMKLTELRAAHIQRYFNELLESKPISTAHTVKLYISICLNEAVRQEYIPRNYCSSVKLPKYVAPTKYPVLSKQEQALFQEGIKGHQFELAFNLNLGTGLRSGELIALKWSDIDFINNTLSVSKSLKKVTYVDRDGERSGKTIVQTPKTLASVRTVPIPENIIRNLKRHKLKQAEEKLRAVEYVDNDYVFADSLGFPIESKRLPRNFKTVLKKQGIRDMKYHSLRHTYATRLFEAQVAVKTVQTLMGHEDITTTMNIYTHVMPEEKASAAESINHLFG